MGFIRTGIIVECDVPEAFKEDGWPGNIACRPEIGDFVRSKKKTKLRVVSITHSLFKLTFEDRDDQINPGLILGLMESP